MCSRSETTVRVHWLRDAEEGYVSFVRRCGEIGALDLQESTSFGTFCFFAQVPVQASVACRALAWLGLAWGQFDCQEAKRNN